MRPNGGGALWDPLGPNGTHWDPLSPTWYESNLDLMQPNVTHWGTLWDPRGHMVIL